MLPISYRDQLTYYWKEISTVSDPLPKEGKLLEIAKRAFIIARAVLSYLALAILGLLDSTYSFFFFGEQGAKEEMTERINYILQQFRKINDQNVSQHSSKIFISMGAGDSQQRKMVVVQNSKMNLEMVKKVINSIPTENTNFSCYVFLKYKTHFTAVEREYEKESIGDDSDTMRRVTKTDLTMLNPFLLTAAKNCGFSAEQQSNQLTEKFEFTPVVVP